MGAGMEMPPRSPVGAGMEMSAAEFEMHVAEALDEIRLSSPR